MDDHDDLARLRAGMDQAREALKEIAGGLGTFYAALLEEGFEPHQALSLCQTLLAIQFNA